jgi:hypothetical protein
MAPRWLSGPAVPLALLLATLAATGCGESKVAKLESTLEHELSAQLDEQRAREQSLRAQEPATAGTPEVARVDCPDGADTGAGSILRCRALDSTGVIVGVLSVVIQRDGKPSWQFTAAAP